MSSANNVRQEELDFDEEARKLFEMLNLPSSGAAMPGCKRYSDIDAIWAHPVTAGTIYVGNRTAASSRDILLRHNIFHIVNCQDMEAPNFHEKDPQYHYFRFPVSYWSRAPNMNTSAGVLKYFEPLFKFIGAALENGQNVLVHCLAGAHRAGTTGVACLMHYADLDYKSALPAAKKCRQAINPIGMLPQLLTLFDKARSEQRDRPPALPSERS